MPPPEHPGTSEPTKTSVSNMAAQEMRPNMTSLPIRPATGHRVQDPSVVHGVSPQQLEGSRDDESRADPVGGGLVSQAQSRFFGLPNNSQVSIRSTKATYATSGYATPRYVTPVIGTPTWNMSCDFSLNPPVDFYSVALALGSHFGPDDNREHHFLMLNQQAQRIVPTMISGRRHTAPATFPAQRCSFILVN